MLVTTTAIHGTELENIKTKIEKYGMKYNANLSTSTRILVTKSYWGSKCRVAREYGIPCVTPSWVLLGHCSIERVNEFEVSKSLIGLEVCGTSLAAKELEKVRQVCEKHQANYNSTLLHSCSMLIVSSTCDILNKTAKIKFAQKHQIKIITYSKFIEKYSEPIVENPERNSIVSNSSSKRKLDLLVYLSPKNLITDKILSLLYQANVRQIQKLTFFTTHVIILGPTTEVFSPYPELEFVSLTWLEECAKQHKPISVDSYRVVCNQRPIITFTGVLEDERIKLSNLLKQVGLSFIIQEDFTLGKTENFLSNELYNTTHLVVGNSTLNNSSKIAALGWRRYKLRRNECFLVTLDWIYESLKFEKWVDCSHFILEIPPLSTFTKLLTCTESIPDIAPAFAKVNSNEEEEKQEKEKELQLCKLPNYTQAETLRSNSLEALIGEIESRTSEHFSSLITPTVSDTHDIWNLNSFQNSKIDNSSNNGNIITTSAASLHFKRNNLEVAPVASQIIVYGRDVNRHSQQIYQHENEEKQEPQSPVLVTKKINTHNKSLSNNTISETSESKVNSLDRVYCIMMAKTLLHMDKDFSQLKALGCTLATTVEECTHYITGKPSRTEFFLCTVAAGKWVLAPSFLEETLREGRMAREELHEWCPEIAKSVKLRNSIVELVKSCQLQRKRKVRAFSLWRVILCCTNSVRTENFSHILRNGGCNCISNYSPSQLIEITTRDLNMLKKFTIVLTDDNLWDIEELNILVKHLPVLKMEYLAHCLCVEDPDPHQYEILNYYNNSNLNPHKRLRVS